MSDNAPPKALISVSVTYANPENPLWFKINIPENSSVEDAIRATDIFIRYPALDLTEIKVGIFGKATELSQILIDGDRVELYQPISVDPKTVPRRKKK